MPATYVTPHDITQSGVLTEKMAASVLSKRTALLVDAISFSLNTFAPRISSCGVLQQIVSYHAKLSKVNVKEPYIPDKQSERTPVWQKTAKYDRKLFGRYGAASGIDPAKLWPSHSQLDEIITEEKEWQPSLEQMVQNITIKDKELADKRRARYSNLCSNCASWLAWFSNEVAATRFTAS